MAHRKQADGPTKNIGTKCKMKEMKEENKKGFNNVCVGCNPVTLPLVIDT